jgi:hypothetical protein
LRIRIQLRSFHNSHNSQEQLTRMSLVDVPHDTFCEYILPHITFKEVGALTMMSKDLRTLCEDNEVWKILYLRTVVWKITDKSVHEFPVRWSTHCDGVDCGCVYGWRFTGIINERTKIKMGYNGPYWRQSQRVRMEHKQVFLEEWRREHENKGLSTVNLCQRVDHYKTETLEIPGCRNYKSFKRETLKKSLTKCKRDLKDTEPVLTKNSGEIEKIERIIAKWQTDLEAHQRRREELLQKRGKMMSLIDKITFITKKPGTKKKPTVGRKGPPRKSAKK